MSYRLLALDLDGTVLDPRGRITERTRTAVAGVVAAGLTVVTCTGRSWRQARTYVAQLGLTGSSIVVGGALTVRTAAGLTHRSRAFPPAMADGVVARLRARGVSTLVTVHAHERAEYLVFRGEPADALDEPRLRRHPEIFHFLDDDGARLPDTLADLEVLRVSTCAPPAVLSALAGDLEAGLAGGVAHHVISAPDLRYPLMEIYPAGVSKWSALSAVAEEHGWTPGEVIAVGDDANDLPMIRGAGLGVAMGNAVPELRAAARRVIGHNADDGLAEFLEALASGRV